MCSVVVFYSVSCRCVWARHSYQSEASLCQYPPTPTCLYKTLHPPCFSAPLPLSVFIMFKDQRCLQTVNLEQLSLCRGSCSCSRKNKQNHTEQIFICPLHFELSVWKTFIENKSSSCRTSRCFVGSLWMHCSSLNCHL